MAIKPEDFIRAIADEVMRRYAAMPQKQPNAVEVQRFTPNGQRRTERVILQQAIAELTDSVQAQSELIKLQISTMQALVGVLEENRLIGKKMLKRNSQNEEDD